MITVPIALPIARAAAASGYVQTGSPNYTLAQYQPPFFVGLTVTANFAP